MEGKAQKKAYNDDGVPTQDATDEQIEAWFASLPRPTPEEAERIDRIIQKAFHSVFGRDLRLKPPTQ